MKLSVIIPTHNPHVGRLQRSLAALRAQDLCASHWECLLIDNSSARPLSIIDWQPHGPANLRIIAEPLIGLSHARLRGFTEGRGEHFVLVDDDNMLAPDYLSEVLRLFAAHPGVGAIGGRSLPEFENAPPVWVREFDNLLALRDLGNRPLLSDDLLTSDMDKTAYPPFAPIGAGMALRRPATQAWIEGASRSPLPDRQGASLSSGGDNDIVFCAMKRGWKVGYFPSLHLTHLIPPTRTTRGYLARLNRGIQQSWMRVLSHHEVNPWPPLSPFGASLRKAKAWFAHRAWSSAPAYIRWQGACGHFEGRILMHSPTRP